MDTKPVNDPTPNLPSAKLLERMMKDRDTSPDLYFYDTHGGKNPSHTKKGPGRYHVQGGKK